MPAPFQIYTDPGVKPAPPQEQNQQIKPRPEEKISIPNLNKIAQQETTASRGFLPDDLLPKTRFSFDIWKLYPIDGDELSFEELRLIEWKRTQKELALKKRLELLEQENIEYRSRIEDMTKQIEDLVQQLQIIQTQQSAPSQPTAGDDTMMMDSPTMIHGGRLSVIPKSLQLAQNDPGEGPDMSMTMCNAGVSVCDDLYSHTAANKFTLPIDQSAYIRQNIPTSTPNHKDPLQKQNNMINRRRSSRAIAGSPTLKLSPITETSRDGNSKSSSSSSSSTPSTIKKARPEVVEAILQQESYSLPDPNNPSTYISLLKNFCGPLDSLNGVHRLPRGLPMMRNAAALQAGPDTYLVEKEIAPGIYSAILLQDDSNEDSDVPFNTVCCRVDKPANEWLIYICTEFHSRLRHLKTKPDIELSIMMTNPAIIYSDASVLFDEYTRYITLQEFMDGAKEAKRSLPKSVVAYIAVELIEIVRQMHQCEILHLNITPNNILIICSPSDEDIKNVTERTSMVKLVGFDRAMDMRLLPNDFKFEGPLLGLPATEVLQSQPWSFEADWLGVLGCIYQMFFNEVVNVTKNHEGRWTVDNKRFTGLPTDIWSALFDQLLNINDAGERDNMIETAIKELDGWIRANLSFVTKELITVDEIAEGYKSILDETRA